MKTKIAFADATATQLAEYAKVTLGLDGIRYQLGKDALIARIRTVTDRDYIEVETAGDEHAAAPTQNHIPSKPASGPMEGEPDDPVAKEKWLNEYVVIHIPENDGPGGSEPVPVGVNGRNIWVPRGREAPLRRKYVKALGDAVKRTPVKDNESEIVSWKNTPQYPFQVLRAANEKDMEMVRAMQHEAKAKSSVAA